MTSKVRIWTSDLLVSSSLGYCEPDPDCANDGWQFHLSKLRKTSKDAGKVGRISWPYDATTNSAYRITGEDEDIQQLWITLEIIGKGKVQVDAEVYTYKFDNKQKPVKHTLDQKLVSDMAVNDEFSLSKGLKKSLRVTRKQDCKDSNGKKGVKYEFKYGDEHTDGIRAYQFLSSNEGDPVYSHKNNADAKGKYCYEESLPWTSRTGVQVKAGIKMHCAFPVW